GEVGGSPPEFRQVLVDRVQYRTGGLTGGDALRVRLPTRQALGPPLGQLPTLQPVEQCPALRILLFPGVEPLLPRGVFPPATLQRAPGVCQYGVLDDEVLLGI